MKTIFSREARSGELSPCPMPLECSFVVWTPIRPLFVLRRWGLAECDRALTPEAIRGGGNNTFIPYYGFCSHLPDVPGHKQAKRSSWKCCTPPHRFKEANCQSTAVRKKKKKKEEKKPAWADTQMAIWMSDFHLVWMHSLTFPSKECGMSCKIEKQQRSLLRLV